MSKFKDTFRVESARLKEWDYSNPCWYYITICTKDHIPHFGEIKNGEMVLNKLGKFLDEEWKKTEILRTNVELDYYIIMPNHLHGIIIVNGSEVETHRVRLGEADNKASDPCKGGDKSIDSGDAFDASLHRIVKNCVSDIIRGFKSSVSHRAKENGYSDFRWQSRFFDRIIRNEKNYTK